MPSPSDRFPFQAIRDAAWTANEACKRLVTPNPFYNGPDLEENARDGLKDLERKVKLRQKLGFPQKPPGYLESQQAYEEELKHVFTDLCDTVRSHLELALRAPRGPAKGPLGWDAERVREYAEAQRLATQDSARAAGRVEEALRRLRSLTPQAPKWPSMATATQGISSDVPPAPSATAAEPPAEPATAKPTDHPSIALLRVFTDGVSDNRIEQASRLLTDDALTVNEKLTKIDALIRFPATASAEKLGDLLGVTKQAVMKTDWWIQNRKGEKDNEIGRRRAGHQKRAREYDKSDATDDDR
jgi:hypothetical protein